MLQLLNRFAWILSFATGFILIIVIAVLIGWFDDRNFPPALFFYGLIFSFIIKGVFLSKNFIYSRLVFFKEKLTGVQAPQSIPEYTSDEPDMQPRDMMDPIKEEALPGEMLESGAEKIKSSAAVLVQPEPTVYEPVEPWFISKFFSENLLAKVGGILVFLGVLFFLTLIYSVVWPIVKMVIGLLIGVGCVCVGMWMDKKWFENESRIVMWVGLLINYLVILWGRYLLGDGSSDLLSVSATFLFLIINTIFAIIISMKYQSRALLIFAFIVAYLNPFLLGSSSSEPYTLLGYTMIVTLGAMYMAYREKDEILFPLAFILPAFIFIVAPWSDGAGWITKLLCINFLWALSLYISTEFKKTYMNVYEILIVGTFFLIGFMWLLWIENLSVIQLLIMWASSLGLMTFCYLYMNRWAYLYSIATVGTALTLTPVLITNGMREDTVLVSTLILWIFAILNIGILVFKNKDMLADNITNIASGLISGALFLAYMIYMYGNKYFDDIGMWVAFFGLGLIYVGLTYFIGNKMTLPAIKENEKYQNICYTIWFIALSFLSLSVAFIASGNNEIISIVWLMEASVLFFVTHRVKSLKTSIAALILFIIGILRFPPLSENLLFFNSSLAGDYGMLIVAVIVLASLIANLYCLSRNNDFSRGYFTKEIIWIHNFFHVVGMVTISVMVCKIFNISWNWNTLLYFSAIVSALVLLYDNFASKWLKIIHGWVYFIFLFMHVTFFWDNLGKESIDMLVSTLIVLVFAVPYIYNYIKKWTLWNRSLFTLFAMYLIALSTLYVSHIFDITFAITIYWGILSFALLSYGISKDILYMRTIWLYIITITAGKIFFYDIWVWVDNVISRVVALMLVGILMIVISTMYTRRYGNTLNDEFSLSNLFPEIDGSTEKLEDSQEQKSPQSSDMMDDIDAVDVEGISSVKMKINGQDKILQVRAKRLTQIIKLVTDTVWKNTFAAWELNDIYESITNNYRSDLSPSQYKRIKDIMKGFVDNGWSVEFIQKKN